ncbi:MAG: F0F1 ATP synthase subunit alpha [Lachnospiraceae bacterium]|nr:F0F1 ATP synthase subunit alpha [Lachnospiraceae bacterium]
MPSDRQTGAFIEFVKDKSGISNVKLKLTQDKSLGGGFILRFGAHEFDWSTSGRVGQLKDKFARRLQHPLKHDENVINILQEEILDFEVQIQSKESGFISWLGDGIAILDGVDHAMYGEVLIFENGTKGMVMNITRDKVGCILFGREENLRVGTKAMRTRERAGVPVGDRFLGRVVDALGAPIDGQGPIKSRETRPIEQPAPGIIDRKSVNEPMETGILAIDSMFPIGKGQRELIIGDRQTGKTSIAIDTIINQRNNDVVCIYVAIGQKASTVAKIVNTLKRNDAMKETIVVSATASDSAPLQYVAPYSGTAMAEYFMNKGRDVLIIYDDLSKHAVAYRSISLLLGRPPGREAFPGDVFYLHSRLLERSSRLSDDFGGGSITALPIIETQAGDLSAYIPTNVISITDGQIFLESDLFFEGQRPAVNVGLSVSRVGGAAQSGAMKKAAGSLRIDLAQYREMAVFTQFASDLDKTTQDQLKQGRVLMEILKQPLEHPLTMEEQVVTLLAANSKLLMDLEPAEVKPFQMDMLKYIQEKHEELYQDLTKRRTLGGNLGERIIEAVKEFMAFREAEAKAAEEEKKQAEKQAAEAEKKDAEEKKKQASEGGK